MIYYIKQENLDFEKWDHCIRNSVNGYVYANSFYLNAMAVQWDALIEDDYASVFPLPFRIKLGVKYIYQPAFIQQLGLFTCSSLSSEKLNDFLAAIPKNFVWIDLNLNKFIIPEMDKKIIKYRQNIELNLQRNYNEIENAYSQNLKRNLKKAHKNKLSVFDSVSPENLIQLFKENNDKGKRYYKSQDYLRFKHLLHTLLHKNMIKIWGVYSPENNLLAAAAFIFSDSRIIFIFSGITEEGKVSAAMPFLIDQFIQHHSSQSLTFDFEGSDNENLARFYKSFGGIAYQYFTIKANRMNPLLSGIFSLYQKLRS